MELQEKSEETNKMPMETIIVAGGCFWCVEAIYTELRGVIKAVSGYAGGSTRNPSYEEVCTGTTGHAEAVEITYDPKVISSHDILRIFFTVHDPTTLNRQGNDSGTQYRSAVFFKNPMEKKLAESVILEVAKARIWPGRIVTTLEPLTIFYAAEAYHQTYFQKFEKADNNKKMQMNAGYCQFTIAPKVAKFRKQFADRLKK
jgi:peptide-methionine (S)-S-oxide reductase